MRWRRSRTGVEAPGVFPEAEADLLHIAGYIARDNPARARSFVGELEQSCAELLGFPDTGRARPDLTDDLRSKPHRNYLIFYTPSDHLVRIERILHGARDVEAAFGGDG